MTAGATAKTAPERNHVVRKSRVISALLVASFTLVTAAPGMAQAVAKRATKKAAKEATESAAQDALEDAAKKGAKKALAPDALDLNSASADQLKKLGLDEATAKNVVDSRPYASLEDPKLTAIPVDMLTKLKGKIAVKAPAK
jgi:DNA uptake protein ComE-like DNA-binding protein